MIQNRRRFIRTALGAPLWCSLGSTVPALLARAAAEPMLKADRDGRVLVVLQLSGGNDGLNTLVPYADDVYARSRPTLRQRPEQVLKLNEALGFHPRMQGFERLFKEGRLAVLQGVGCPDLSRDHDEALLSWQVASRETAGRQTGWLGRAADRLWETTRPVVPAAFVGEIAPPFGLHAARAIIPTVRPAQGSVWSHEGAALPRGPEGRPAGSVLLRHVVVCGDTARRHMQQWAEAETTGAAGYPECSLGRELRTVARLVRADLGLRLFFVELGGGGIGGFDNHANQLGNHCALLEQLSTAITAFLDELAAHKLEDRVVLLTFSEFGRTLAENGRRGTDHGAAGPMFLAGGAVQPGLHGGSPSLTDLEGGALRHQVDFRAVYRSVLEDWLQLPSANLVDWETKQPGLLRSTRA